MGAPAASGAAETARPLLPNVVALPSTSVERDGDMIYGDTSTQPSVGIDGCRADEYVEESARRCLRFDTVAANLGAGPLELRYRPAAGTEADLVQRIYTSHGGSVDRRAAGAEFHPIHGHFHYENFALTKLWRASKKGRKLGREPIRSGDKNGFCLMDGEQVNGTQDEPRRYDCVDYEGPEHVTGISPGWADIYVSDLADQYIEITGVPDGHYLLVTTLDPDRTLKEKTRRDNTASTHVLLCGTEVSIISEKSPQTICPD
jgi:hypothetical protein